MALWGMVCMYDCYPLNLFLSLFLKAVHRSLGYFPQGKIALGIFGFYIRVNNNTEKVTASLCFVYHPVGFESSHQAITPKQAAGSFLAFSSWSMLHIADTGFCAAYFGSVVHF